MFVSEILDNLLGEEATDLSVWKATRDPGKGKEIALSVAEEYSITELDPVPRKSSTSYRPAFLSDYEGGGVTPYDLEFEFVTRSLNYADQVAVVDEVGEWVATGDYEKAIDQQIGYYNSVDYVIWSLRRIAKYAPLERASLLYYVARENALISDEMSLELARMADVDMRSVVKDKLSATGSEIDSVSELISLQSLSLWFQEFFRSFNEIVNRSEYFDLYLPSFFAGKEVLDWLLDNIPSVEKFNNNQFRTGSEAVSMRNMNGLNAMMDVPALDATSLLHNDARYLLNIREMDHLEEWRIASKSRFQLLSQTGSASERIVIVDDIKRLAQELTRKERKRSDAGTRLTDTLVSGFSVVPVALATGQPATLNSVLAAAPDVGGLLQKFISWMFGNNRTDVDEEVRDRGTEVLAIRRYLSEGGQFNQPRGAPFIFGRRLNGRPIYLDIFDS
ncbi:hypothetical protein [Corynebacterium sp. CNJ-954]|uniref:hypothetical protein n=1 Tax=Corynebacterium sp. CNJ-954 TaxID=1904962 RepID=UPI0011153F85|nr:hypothetical protein [Corynebacterium sp. CNJ-954]